jgi:hypothetical protein
MIGMIVASMTCRLLTLGLEKGPEVVYKTLPCHHIVSKKDGKLVRQSDISCLDDGLEYRGGCIVQLVKSPAELDQKFGHLL